MDEKLVEHVHALIAAMGKDGVTGAGPKTWVYGLPECTCNWPESTDPNCTAHELPVTFTVEAEA